MVNVIKVTGTNSAICKLRTSSIIKNTVGTSMMTVYVRVSFLIIIVIISAQLP